MVAGFVDFQIRHAEFPLLNIGVGANPTGLEGSGVVHLDLDRWRYRNFVQGNAIRMPFKSDSFRAALLGDVLEHLEDPLAVLLECHRVAPKLICTVFNEWRLPGPGQWIEAGRRVYGDLESHYQPFLESGQCVARYSEEKISHSPHINQWESPQEVERLFADAGFRVELFESDCPGVHEGHRMENWCFVARRQ